MKKILLFTVFSVLAAAPAIGQSIKTDFEVRSRAELRAGFQEPLSETLNPAWVNNLRTRINLSHESDKFAAKVSLLDSRTLGSTAPGNSGTGTGVLEAWGEYRFSSRLSFSIGRRAVEYDQGRIFSAGNWSNTLTAHDLLLIRYNGPVWSVNVGSAYNNASNVNFEGITPYTLTYKTLNFVRAERTAGPLALSTIWVNEGFQGGVTDAVTNDFRNTVGLNLWPADPTASTDYRLTGYYQFGHDRAGRSLNAYLLALSVKQRLNETFSLKIGGDLYSGSDNNLAANQSRTFNKLYGTNHAFNGSMEYWRTLPTQGLVDINAGATARFTPRFNLDLTYHYFASARQIDPQVGKALGSEIDLTANYTVSDLLAIQGGWSAYFTTKGTDALKQTIGIPTRFPQWAYIQLTFKIK